GLSPMAEDALKSTPLLALPAIVLLRAGASVPIPDDPKNPSASHVRWTSQQSMAFDVFPGLNLAPGAYDISVTNANGPSALLKNALAAVPPPVLTNVAPNPVCNAQGTSTLTLTGTGFLTVGDAKPTVKIDGNAVTVTAVDGTCTPVTGTTLMVQSCTTI